MNAPTDTAVAASPALLQVSNLSVGFGTVRALSDVELTVAAGELRGGDRRAGRRQDDARALPRRRSRPGRGRHRARRRSRCPPTWPALSGAASPSSGRTSPCATTSTWPGNLLLGQETRAADVLRVSRSHAAAAALLGSLQIPIRDTTRLVGSLSGGQRQLLALAKALSRDPRLLVLDEPTASLGVLETAQVERLIRRRRGRAPRSCWPAATSSRCSGSPTGSSCCATAAWWPSSIPALSHPDDVAALLSGQQVDSSARRQLTRLHGLADRLVSADPSSSLSLILSALGAALGTEKVCIHVVSGTPLHCAASLGFAPEQIAAWSRLPFGPAAGRPGRRRRRASGSSSPTCGSAGPGRRRGSLPARPAHGRCP